MSFTTVEDSGPSIFGATDTCDNLGPFGTKTSQPVPEGINLHHSLYNHTVNIAVHAGIYDNEMVCGRPEGMVILCQCEQVVSHIYQQIGEFTVDVSNCITVVSASDIRTHITQDSSNSGNEVCTNIFVISGGNRIRCTSDGVTICESEYKSIGRIEIHPCTLLEVETESF